MCCVSCALTLYDEFLGTAIFCDGVTLSKHGYEIAWLIHRISYILWKFQRMYTLATSYVSLK